MSILASAADSLLDFTASSVNYFSIRKSEKPPDDDHRFGHGKAEGLAGLFQCFVIGVSSIYLIYVSIEKIIYGSELRKLDLGIGVMAFTIVVSFIVARYIKSISEQTDSIALHADSFHYEVDVYTNIGSNISTTNSKAYRTNISRPYNVYHYCYSKFFGPRKTLSFNL